MTLLCTGLRAGLLTCALLATGCVTVTHSIQQTTLVTLPTAPPPAPTSGGVGLDLGASIPTTVSAEPTGAASGLSVPVAQPDGGLAVRLADFVTLRGFFAIAPAEEQRAITGSIEGPDDVAWMAGLGASFRFLFADDIVFVDVAPSVGFAIVPSRFEVTVNRCPDGEGCRPAEMYTTAYHEAVPILAATLHGGIRPLDWLTFRVGLTVRNQPTNEAAFETGDTPDSSVSPGPFGLVVHGGVQLDFIDALGIRADLHWPAAGFGLDYGPIVVVGVQGRIEGSRSEPFGLRL